MNFSSDQAEGIKMAAAIHDIGKLSVPAEILSKPSKLSDIEFQLIQIHPEAGYNIVKDIEFPWPIATIIMQHHERMNGSGYPKGLKGEEILPETRILSCCRCSRGDCLSPPIPPCLRDRYRPRRDFKHEGYSL